MATITRMPESGKCRWNEDNGHVGPGLFNGLAERVKYGPAEMLCPPFTGGDAADDVGAILNHLPGMEGPFGPGEPLYNYPRIFIY